MSESITLVTYVFFIFLILAIVTERMVEILISFFKYLEYKTHFYPYWNKRAIALSKKLSTLSSFQLEGDSSGKIAQLFFWQFLKSTVSSDSAKNFKISTQLVRMRSIQFISRVLTIAIGILLSYAFYRSNQSVDLITVINERLTFIPLATLEKMSVNYKILISGLIIGTGVEPIHKMISNFEKSADKKTKEVKRG